MWLIKIYTHFHYALRKFSVAYLFMENQFRGYAANILQIMNVYYTATEVIVVVFTLLSTWRVWGSKTLYPNT